MNLDFTYLDLNNILNNGKDPTCSRRKIINKKREMKNESVKSNSLPSHSDSAGWTESVWFCRAVVGQ